MADHCFQNRWLEISISRSIANLRRAATHAQIQERELNNASKPGSFLSMAEETRFWPAMNYRAESRSVSLAGSSRLVTDRLAPKLGAK